MSHDTFLVLMAIALSTTAQFIGICAVMRHIGLIQTMLLKIQANDLERMLTEKNAKKAMQEMLSKPPWKEAP